MSSFLDFIKQEPLAIKNNIQEIEEIQEIQEIEKVNPDKFEAQPKSKFSFNKNEKNVKEMYNINHNTFNEFFFRKGNFIKVIRTPRKYQVDDKGNIQTLEQNTRLCDIYCGYIGEIKQFFKGDDSAMVILHGLNNVQPITFPIECLVKIN